MGAHDPLPDTVITFTRITHHDTYPFVDPTRILSMRSKHVFVTAATRSAGRAMAVSYAKAGAAMIAIGARSNVAEVKAEVEAAAAAAGRAIPKVVPVDLDTQDEGSIARAASLLRGELKGRLDVLLNNAGSLEADQLIGGAESAWEINVRGPWLVTRAFLPLLLACDEGAKTVVNVNSIGAQLISPGGSAYQTARFSLLRLTEFMNAEYGAQGVVAYCMHPGAVKSELRSKTPDELVEKLVDTPELMADTNAFLTQEKREWLGGRYISCTWDMEEFFARKDEIVATGRLKMRS